MTDDKPQFHLSQPGDPNRIRLKLEGDRLTLVDEIEGFTVILNAEEISHAAQDALLFRSMTTRAHRTLQDLFPHASELHPLHEAINLVVSLSNALARRKATKRLRWWGLVAAAAAGGIAASAVWLLSGAS